MGIYLNPGNQGFKESVNSKIYIDKTRLISYTNECLNTEQKYVCVSRPRRFGKSMTLKMLAAYYGSGYDSVKLFEPYKISEDESFKEYINKYNVLFINMSDFLDRDSTKKMIINLKSEIMEELYEKYSEYITNSNMELNTALQKIYVKTGKQFVFLIDEWDCVMRVKYVNQEQQRDYLDFLRKLLKDKMYVALAYMTGILPIKKYGEHSALNMFDEYSMTNAVPISEFTGFTNIEVKELCDCYGVSFDKTNKWYNGYTVDGISIFNPKSVVSVMLRKRFDSYWNFTETYDALKVYICMNMDGLRDKVIRMIAKEEIEVDTTSFQNDMTTFKSSDDILTLLIHLGYLTYNFETGRAKIPNDEVALEYIKSIRDGGWENVINAINASNELLIATLEKDTDKVSEILEKVHADNTSILQYNDENSLSCVISLAYYSAKKDYVIYRELPSGIGYADIVFVPRKGVNLPAIIVELKYDKSIKAAINQIHDRNYMDCLKDYSGEMLLVGINYDKNTSGKRHSCVIEEWQCDVKNEKLDK